MANRSAVRSLGEVALRVCDLPNMVNFYENVVGLEPMQVSKRVAFFRIAEGYGGHTTVLALFDRSDNVGYVPPSSDATSVDHLAFTIDLADYPGEKQRLEQLGYHVTTAEHAWVQWRSLYLHDPEGNVVELVCFDPSIQKEVWD